MSITVVLSFECSFTRVAGVRPCVAVLRLDMAPKVLGIAMGLTANFTEKRRSFPVVLEVAPRLLLACLVGQTEKT